MDRDVFLKLFAQMIQQEAEDYARQYGDELSEPYRNAGYRLVDEALDIIP